MIVPTSIYVVELSRRYWNNKKLKTFMLQYIVVSAWLVLKRSRQITKREIGYIMEGSWNGQSYNYKKEYSSYQV